MLHIEGPIATSEELRAHVVTRIESGEWEPGERLPSVRRLADQLGLAPNTVAKAYRELEAAGWVHTAGRRGTMVAEQFDGNTEVRGLELAIAYLQSMRGLGFTADDAARFVHRAAGG
ncbi:MAG TPA: GntR family transcriptional regulator [Propionibacterium sp.]|jgi:DNA-binding transcriptional regulator YhcF (GntR family)|nr:GntR family transcriptional regulator [Propionibacterium sp.]